MSRYKRRLVSAVEGDAFYKEHQDAKLVGPRSGTRALAAIQKKTAAWETNNESTKLTSFNVYTRRPRAARDA